MKKAKLIDRIIRTRLLMIESKYGKKETIAHAKALLAYAKTLS